MKRFAELRRALPHWVIDPLARILARTGVNPNLISVLGLLLAGVAALLIAGGSFLWGGVVILVGGSLDMLDGALARAQGRASVWGALLDSTLDRLGEGVLLLGLVAVYTKIGGQTEILLVFVVLVASFMISYVKARAEGLGLECGVGLMQRPERLVVLAAGLLLNQVAIALWILAILTPLTVAQRLYHLWRAAGRLAGNSP